MKGRIAHLIANKEESLEDLLARELQVPPAQTTHLLQLGSLYLNKERLRTPCIVKAADYIRAHVEPRRFSVEGIDWRSRILFQNEFLLVLNKPNGVPMHATVDNAVENCIAQMEMVLGEPLLVTHRLDNQTSGVVMVSKRASFTRKFNELLNEGRVRKRYRALVDVAPSLGRKVGYLCPTERAPRIFSEFYKENWEYCELAVDAVRPMGRAFELEIELFTGRTHQIRVQLAALGCPIRGDDVYGGSSDSTLRLHSAQLQFGLRREWHNYVQAPPWAEVRIETRGSETGTDS